jgi:hypothetical protein
MHCCHRPKGKQPMITERQYSSLLKRCQRSAVARGIDFALTEEQFGVLRLRAGDRCELTKIEFSNEVRSTKQARRPFFPSIDRIRSNEGYRWDNVRLVCSCVNTALHVFGDDVFARMCLSFAENVDKLDVRPSAELIDLSTSSRRGIKTRGTAEHPYYQPIIMHNRKRYSLGVFSSLADAQARYLEAKRLVSAGQDFAHLHDGTFA